MLCALILYMSGGSYSLKSTPNDRFLRSSSWQFYLYSDFLPEIYWEAVAKKIFFFIISFWCLIWDLSRGLTSNKPTLSTRLRRLQMTEIPSDLLKMEDLDVVDMRFQETGVSRCYKWFDLCWAINLTRLSLAGLRVEVAVVY